MDDADAVAQNTKKIADLQTNIKQWEAQIEREKQQIDAAHRNTERMYPNGYDHSLFNSFEAFQASQHKFIDGRSTYIANLRHNISEANEQIERLQLSNRILTTDTPESIKEREIQEGAYASSKIAAAQVKIDAETTATRKAIDKKVADATPAERTRLFGALIWEKLPAAERKTFNTLFSVTALATAAGMATALVAFRNYAIAKLPGRVAPHLMIAFTSYHVTRMQLAWINAMDATTSAELDKQATIFAESFTNLVGDLAVAGAAYGLSKLPTLARAIRTPYAAQTAAEIAEMAAAASKTYCFAEGTPLLTPDGSKSIENFKVGDAILSADENDCQCRVQLRHVEQIHRRSSLVMCLSLGGREIRLTQNHPIFTPDRGWVQAGELRIGDYVLGHDGKAVPIDGVEEDGRLRTVYNLTISGLHTFFVGGSDWGFSVWVHNLDCGEVWRALAGANAGEIPEEAGAVLRAIVDAVAEKQSPSVIARLLKQIKLPGGPKTDQELTLVADQAYCRPKDHNTDRPASAMGETRWIH